MNKRNKKILVAPIIGKVCQLNAYMIANGKRAYKIIQHNYIDELLKQGFGEWLYFREEPGHLVCVLKSQYKPQHKAALKIEQFIKLHENETWQIHERNYRPRRSRGRNGNRRAEAKRS